MNGAGDSGGPTSLVGPQGRPHEAEPARRMLHWRCRRGMLELDVLLQGFLREGVDHLDDASCAAFMRLLDYPDTALLRLLMGQMRSGDREVAHVIEAIRRSARDST